MNKNYLAILLLTIIVVFTGCNGVEEESVIKEQLVESIKETDSTTEELKKMETASESRKIIIDDLGYEVILPKEISRIVIADLPPLVHAYYVVNGSVDGLVGAPSNNAITNTMLPRIFPEVHNLESGFREGGNLNMEELLSLNPDVILYRSDNDKTGEIIRNSGVPAIAFQTFNGDNGNTVTAVESWLKTLGELLDKEEKTQKITGESYKMMGLVQSRMWDILEEDKVRMIYLSNTSKEQIRVSGKGLFGRFWAEIAEGIDASGDDIKGAKNISMEQLYNYNPEVMFMVFSSLTPEDIYNDPAYAEIEAVKNHRVYAVPSGVFTWYGPSTDIPLSFLWHAMMLYPESFEDIDFIELTKTYYKDNYNYEMTENDIMYLFTNSLEVINRDNE